MTEGPYLTSEGATKLRIELEELKGNSRLEIASRLRAAIQMGDLSENADYHKAKEDQAFLEGRIQELEYILSNAVIIEDKGIRHDIVDVGSHVVIQEDGDEPVSYQIVGAKEASPRNGKISNESPIGRALLGHREGDEIIVEAPVGSIQYKIISIR